MRQSKNILCYLFCAVLFVLRSISHGLTPNIEQAKELVSEITNVKPGLQCKTSENHFVVLDERSIQLGKKMVKDFDECVSLTNSVNKDWLEMYKNSVEKARIADLTLSVILGSSYYLQKSFRDNKNNLQENVKTNNFQLSKKNPFNVEHPQVKEFWRIYSRDLVDLGILQSEEIEKYNNYVNSKSETVELERKGYTRYPEGDKILQNGDRQICYQSPSKGVLKHVTFPQLSEGLKNDIESIANFEDKSKLESQLTSRLKNNIVPESTVEPNINIKNNSKMRELKPAGALSLGAAFQILLLAPDLAKKYVQNKYEESEESRQLTNSFWKLFSNEFNSESFCTNIKDDVYSMSCLAKSTEEIREKMNIIDRILKVPKNIKYELKREVNEIGNLIDRENDLKSK